METLHNGYILDFPPGVFPLSTDSMVLSHFVRLPKNAAVLDLCSGCGTLGHLLCAKDSGCNVTGVELSTEAHDAALQNIERNGLSIRLSSICGDIRNITELLPGRKFAVCVSNPPYFSAGPASKNLTGARREDSCTAEDLFSAAAKTVKYGGDFYLVHRPERLGELFALADRHGFAPKRLMLVRHKAGGPVILVLLQCRRGGKHGLSWEEISLFTPSGEPTPEYREIYHL